MSSSRQQRGANLQPVMSRSSAAVHAAVNTLAAGGMVVVVDDADREDEGDLVLAAATATPEQIAFVVRHTTGILCAPMGADRIDRLDLPQMVERSSDPHATAFTISVDHVDSGTGVSAADRALTFRALSDAETPPADLRRPGHVFPLRAVPGGVLERGGHTEAAVDLLTLAGCEPVGVISEIVADDGTMMRGRALRHFAAEHDLPMLSVADLASYRRATERHVERVASATMPTEFGDFRAVAFRSFADGGEHLVLTKGDVSAAGASPAGALVRVHSECLTGDILGSLRCDCGTQLEQALRAIDAEGCGAVVYLRGHEGRGIGLADKIHAYCLQDGGLDTVDANTAQGLPVDARSYETAAHILEELGVHRVRLITNNPEKCEDLERQGREVVTRVALEPMANAHNQRYLRTKRDRMGHVLPEVV